MVAVWNQGKHAGGTGQLECTECTAGKYSDRNGSSACTNCTAGRWSVAVAARCVPAFPIQQLQTTHAHGAALTVMHVWAMLAPVVQVQRHVQLPLQRRHLLHRARQLPGERLQGLSRCDHFCSWLLVLRVPARVHRGGVRGVCGRHLQGRGREPGVHSVPRTLALRRSVHGCDRLPLQRRHNGPQRWRVCVVRARQVQEQGGHRKLPHVLCGQVLGDDRCHRPLHLPSLPEGKVSASQLPQVRAASDPRRATWQLVMVVCGERECCLLVLLQ